DHGAVGAGTLMTPLAATPRWVRKSLDAAPVTSAVVAASSLILKERTLYSPGSTFSCHTFVLTVEPALPEDSGWVAAISLTTQPLSLIWREPKKQSTSERSTT